MVVAFVFMLMSCGGGEKKTDLNNDDSLQTEVQDSTEMLTDSTDTVSQDAEAVAESPRVVIYYFHATHRCATCMAIEECIDNVLKNDFSSQVKAGTVSLKEINADEDENEDLCEKYEAFGTSVFVTRLYKGTEKSENMTADAFKLAVSRPGDFEEHLKYQIENYLKK